MGRHILSILLLALAVVTASAQDAFDPTPPADPSRSYRVNVSVLPVEAGSASGGGSYATGTWVYISTYSRGDYQFKRWELNGKLFNESSGFYCTVDNENLDFVAIYELKPFEPALPADPDTPVEVSRLFMQCQPYDGGYYSGYSGAIYETGTQVWVSATAYPGFVFQGWFDDNGELVNANRSFYYTTGSSNTMLTARFTYAPQLPGDPDRPQGPELSGYILTMDVEEGWNWVSSFLDEPLAIDLLFAQGALRVLTQAQETVLDNVFGIVGQVKSINPGVGYKVFAGNDFLATFSGSLHNVGDRPVQVRRGWNWISCPFDEPRPVAGAIVNAQDGDYLVSQAGFAEFCDGTWEGSVSMLCPGQGYLYRSVTDKTLDLDSSSPGNAPARVGAVAAIDGERLPMRAYPNTMNVIARLTVDGCEGGDDRYEVRAYCGDQLRGKGVFVNGTCYITVYGDRAAAIYFVVKDLLTGECLEARETLVFSSDIVGSRHTPFALTAGASTAVCGTRQGASPRDVFSITGVKQGDCNRPGVYIMRGGGTTRKVASCKP